MATNKGKKDVPKMQDEIHPKEQSCPWCAYRKPQVASELKELNKNPKLNEYQIGELNTEAAKYKDGSLVRLAGTKWQCDDCGKHWEPTSLGKPWTVELERGEAWAKEALIKKLQGV